MPNIDTEQLIEYALPLSWVLGGWIVGWILERVIVGRLRSMARRTSWKGDDLLVDGVRGLVRFAFLILGIHMAILQMPIGGGVSSILGKGVVIASILLGTVLVSRIATGAVAMYTSRVEGVLPSTSIFLTLTRVAIFVLGVLISLQSIGISIAPLLTALGVGGLATALALQPTLSNLFSGIQILASRAIKPGDFVRLDSGEEGYVQDISWRIAVIRTVANNLILVPNAKLADAVVTNYHATDSQLALVIPVGIAYDTDLEKMERVTLEVAREIQTQVAGGVEDFEPLIRYSELADSSVNLKVILRVREWGDQSPVRSEFLRRILLAYAREGIEIPFPQRVIHNAR
ncbi:MAG: mechanosensitive ion channel family protein [Fibrobacteria bacterium]|nr:mechanosensitive ion channel family protein [Fibrobacteria bacterium]